MLISKSYNDTTRKNLADIPDKHRCKNPQHNSGKLNLTSYKKIREKILADLAAIQAPISYNPSVGIWSDNDSLGVAH
jgi:hypothetical protein